MFIFNFKQAHNNKKNNVTLLKSTSSNKKKKYQFYYRNSCESCESVSGQKFLQLF